MVTLNKKNLKKKVVGISMVFHKYATERNNELIITIPVRKYAYTSGHEKVFIQKIEIVVYDISDVDTGEGIFRLSDVNVRHPYKKGMVGGDRRFVECIRELLRESGIPERYTQEMSFVGEYKNGITSLSCGIDFGNYMFSKIS